MIENILWLAVGLMVTSSAVPRTLRIRKLVGGIGWCTFSIYWSYQPFHYLKVLDYVNVLLSIVVTLFLHICGIYYVSRVQRRPPSSTK